MNPNVAAFFNKAHRALATARNNVRDGDAEGAVNRAYYAAYYAASAALLAVGESPKTHIGVHNRFRVCFIHSGEIPDSIGKTLALAFHLRQQADYDAVTIFDVQAASDLIEDVDIFVTSVEGMEPT